MKKLIFFLSYVAITTLSGFGQKNIEEIDTNVNEGKGTVVFRKMIKGGVRGDSSELRIRIFQPFWKQIKGSNNGVDIIGIDSTNYKISANGFIEVKLKEGIHKIRAVIDYWKPFKPINELSIRAKKGKIYFIDLYLPLPFFPDTD